MYIPHSHRRYITQEQLKELKKEINKTEYEKAREPLNAEINDLHKEIFFLRNKIDSYNMLIKDIINDIICDEIVLPKKKIIECCNFNGSAEILKNIDHIEFIKIPVKPELKKYLYMRLQQIEREEIYGNK